MKIEDFRRHRITIVHDTPPATSGAVKINTDNATCFSLTALAQPSENPAKLQTWRYRDYIILYSELTGKWWVEDSIGIFMRWAVDLDDACSIINYHVRAARD